MKLYEIAESYKNLEEVIENTDDENIIELVKASLLEVEGDLVTKCENICKLIKNYEADIKSYKEEERRLATQRKVQENKLDHLKKYLFETVSQTKSKKVETSIFKLGVRKTPAKLIIEDENKINEKFKVVKFDWDKASMKEALKNGEEIEGVKLEQGESLSIR